MYCSRQKQTKNSNSRKRWIFVCVRACVRACVRVVHSSVIGVAPMQQQYKSVTKPTTKTRAVVPTCCWVSYTVCLVTPTRQSYCTRLLPRQGRKEVEGKRQERGKKGKEQLRRDYVWDPPTPPLGPPPSSLPPTLSADWQGKIVHRLARSQPTTLKLKRDGIRTCNVSILSTVSLAR